MSKTIDEKVVEMRFDNSNFEKNTAQTMSTLDKLKQKLNLTGASKGLENINTTANKINMSGMANALDNVHSKFSALEIMGVTALANITNSAVNAGKRMVKALTIDPVMDGFSEYEMTLNAIQTTMAGTGKTAKEVEEQLKLLDIYADKTVYSTSDMLNNLPKFTNAGVELEKATTAMIGIANATALAGGDAGKASIAFYNLGQAIGTGYLTRMDYNSINNAGIATMEWKNQMVEAAIAQGTLTKVGENAYKSGKKTYTLQQLFIDGLQTQWATTDVMMKVFGDYGDETTEIGKKSYAAAQDIKTFSMMMDSLKATAGTGWKDTWQIIFGDLDEAKEFWTGLTNFISNIVTGMADFRNAILESALGKGFKNLKNSLSSILKPVKTVVDGVKKVTTSLEDLETMANRVIRGDFGNGKKRFDELTGGMYNYYAIQNRVNEKLGDSFRYSDEVVNSFNKLNKSTDAATESTTKLADSESERLEQLVKMSDEELKNLGMKPDQIEALRELKKYSDMTGLSIKEFVDNIDEIDGRWLLINTFKNAAQGLTAVFKALKDAWRETFFGKDASSEDVTNRLGESLFKLIAALHKFSTYLKVNDEAAENFKNTFKGLFSLLDIVLTIIGGPIKIGLKILAQLFKALDFSVDGVLELTGGIGKAISSFHDWLEEVLDFTAVFEFLVPFIQAGISAVKGWFKSFSEWGPIKQFTEYLNKSGESIKNWFSNLNKMSPEDVKNFFKSILSSIKTFFLNINDQLGGIPGDIISGLSNGLKNGASKVLEGVISLATFLIDKFKELLGIHSPSKVFFAIGGFIIAGLVGGLLAGGTDIGNAIGGIATKISEFFGNIDWNKIFSAGMSAGLLLLAKKLTNIVDNITAPMRGVGNMLDGVGEVLEESAVGIGQILKNTAKVVKSFSKVLNGFAFKTRMEGIKELAISLLILVGAIAILTFLDTDKMWEGVKVILALSVILAILAVAMNKISQASVTITKEGFQASGVKSSLLSIGIALLAMAAVVKMLGKMSPDQIKQGFAGLAGAVIALGVLMAAYGKLIKGKAAQNMDKAGKMMRKLGTALLLLAVVAKIVGGMEWTELGKAAIFVGAFTLFVWALVAITKGTDKHIDKVGNTLLKISAAMLILTIVIKRIGKLDIGTMLKGAAFMAGFTLFVWAMVSILKSGKDTQIAKVGGTLLAISAAMLIMTGVIKLIAGMEWDELGKGAVGIIALGGIIAGLLYMVKKIGPEAPKLAGTLLAMAAAIGILAAVTFLLGMMDIPSLAKGLVAVGILSLFMTMLVKSMKSTEGAADIKGTFIGMAIAIAVMAAAVAALSFIDWTKLLPATIALGALMGMFALMIKSLKGIDASIGPLIVMTVAVAVLGGLCIALANTAPDGAIKAALSLSLLMGAMILLLKNVSKMKTNVKDSLNVVLNLLVLCVPLAALAGILYLLKDTNNSISSVAALSILMAEMTGLVILLSKFKASVSSAIQGAIGILALCVPLVAIAGILILMNFANGNVLTNVIALSVLLSVMTGVLVILSFVGGLVSNALMGAVGLLALCVPLVAIAGILILMNFTENVMTNVMALSAMLLVMTGVLTVLSLVGALVPNALLGALGLLALCIPLVAMAGILILMNNCEDAMGNAKALSLLLITMAGVLTILAMVGPMALIGVAAIGALTMLIGAIGVFAVGVGYLMEKCPELQEFLNIGIPVLIQLAGGIGEMIGAFVNGVLTQIASGLPEIGTNLSLFMDNLQPFITGAKLIDQAVLDGIGILALTILALTGAQLLEGVASFLTGGSSFADLGTQLSQFMINAMPFIMLSKMIDPAIMTGVKSLAEAVMILTAADILEGITSWLTGGNSLANFGSQLGQLGTDLKSFVTNLGTFTEEQVTTVDCAGRAIKALAESAKTLPNEGGWLASLVGENSLATFGGYLPGLGTNLKSFVTNLGTFTEEQVTTVDCAGRAIKALAEAAKEIPNEGGIWASIVGDNSLSTFGSYLPGLGTHLKGFVTNLGTFGDDQIKTVECACSAISGLANAAKNIPNEGGMWAKIFGDNSLSTFGNKLPGLAEDIKGFVSALGEFTDAQVNTVYSACDAIYAVSQLGYIDLGTTGSGLESFGNNMVKFAKKVKEFVDKISESSSDSITGAIDKIKKLIDMATTISSVSIDSLINFAVAMKKVAEEGVNKFVEALSGDDPTSKAKEAMKAMLQAGIDGADEKKSDVKGKFEEVAKEAVDGLSKEEFKTSATTAGKDLVQGLINGLTNQEKKNAVYNAAYALGKLAVKGEKDGQESNSPSKATERAGKWLGEGLIVGIKNIGGKVYSAGERMGEKATNSISNALDTAFNLLNSDMDNTPTIRPVLDLSDVESGVGTLSSMFNNGPSLGVMANLSAISSGMNTRNQNGANDEVISAINKLSKNLGNVSGNTYNINGITYDDGSNITEAVQSLVRAAKVERRM